MSANYTAKCLERIHIFHVKRTLIILVKKGTVSYSDENKYIK